MKKTFLTFALFSLFGCKNKVTEKVHYPSLDSSKDNSWGGDVNLSIINTVKTAKYTLYTLKSVYNNDTLGFQLLVPFKGDHSSYGTRLQIISMGAISKNFKNVLAGLYKVKVNKEDNFAKNISLSYVDLNTFSDSVKGNENVKLEGKEQLKSEKINYYKLFFEDEKDSADGEAEIFLNINESAR